MLQALFWICAGLLVYTHVGYPLLLWLLPKRRVEPPSRGLTPSTTLVVAAHDEGEIIARKVQNARALDHPGLEVIVASDGSSDDTVANAAGADLVLDLPRAGKVRAQDAAVAKARGEIVAFSDANSFWQPDALTHLLAPFEDPEVGYVCGQVRFTNDSGDNQEGLYWRYEMWIRSLESRLAGVTGGNGAIYAVRREAYIEVDPRMGHDLSFPFNMVKRGWKPVYAPAARAEEKMVPSIEGEFRRKRRMQAHMWPIVLQGGLASPRGYSPLYALQIYSHRVLRYLTPLLHVVALAANALLLGHGAAYVALFAAQCALLAAALVPVGPLRIARYYVAMTAAIAVAFFDWLRKGTPAGWDQAEGTR